MRIFEFQFNPKSQNRRIKTSFFEKGRTSLYLIGEVDSANDKILSKVMKVIKEGYSPSFKLKEVLVEANESLSTENLAWLGNLNLIVLSIVGNNVELAKIGKGKVFLISRKKATELNGETESSSFGTITSGKIAKGERIVVLTEELIDNKILNEIAESDFLDNKILEKMIDERKKELNKISGALLLLDNKAEKRPLMEDKAIDFSTKDLIQSIKSLPLPEKIYNKKIFLVILMLFLLLIGFLVFNADKPSKMKKIENEIAIANELISLNREDKAFLVLKDLYQRSLDLGANNLNQEIVLLLNEISKIDRLDEIEPIISLSTEEMVPQKIMAVDQTVYLYGPLSDKILAINTKTDEKKVFSLSVKPGSSAIMNGRPIFFIKPNTILDLINNSTVEIKVDGSSLSGLTTFNNSLYLRDSTENEIFKYSSLKADPEAWFKEKPTDIKSMAVDGSVWILSSDNEISRYSAGNFQEKLSVEIFPFIKSISRISTYPTTGIFLLEPVEKRIIVLNKDGSLIKQIRSDSFDNLIDFWVSPKGEIFLLNGSDVYYLSSI